ncbi:cupin domain-containing protein [Vannielia sp.]|uniref:(R)-mandelonitrile lyase n=1 Tax=Vannielia sp. TaxID=2813045 RepID=UPI0026030578|nr:cupin domain-containing protein [Vannielia sp.]MDF1873549.1 cupin domain-containing protein [Vannielia sp.]
MKITRAEDQPTAKGSADYFIGDVRLDNAHSPEAGAAAGAAIVSFAPGARTAWHTHPRGQLIIVTAGLGWVQRDGGEKQAIRPGDKVWFEPGERHWHGAQADHAMVHVAVHEAENGTTVAWLEQVSEADYLA